MLTNNNISFSLYSMNGPNKLECYITLGWKGLLGINTIAYWAQFFAHFVNIKRGFILYPTTHWDIYGQFTFSYQVSLTIDI
jgi:hypothetical protein